MSDNVAEHDVLLITHPEFRRDPKVRGTADFSSVSLRNRTDSAEAHLNWRPHEKSMSLGQLALHVATLPRQLTEFVTGDALDFAPQALRRRRSAVTRNSWSHSHPARSKRRPTWRH